MSSTDTGHFELDGDALRTLFTDARTANTFSDEPVTRDQLRAITDLAKWPPTASNTNPLRITFLTTEEAKARLVPLMAEGNQQKTAASPVVALLAVDLDFHDHLPQLFPFRPEMREQLADLADVREQLATFNGALQTAYLILAIRAAGLAAGPMRGFDAEAVDAEFFADRPYKSILVINVGKPADGAWRDRLPRLEHEQYVDYL